MKRSTFILLHLFVVFSVGLAGSVSAFETENIILVSVDGLRDTEAFAYEFEPGQTEHPYMPFIWNTLKPQGTAYMEMYNIVCTFTTPAHSTMLTGNWIVSPQIQYPGLGMTHQARPWAPTIFEYARKTYPEFDPDTTWCVVGKRYCKESNWSVHPAYGREYGAKLMITPEELTVGCDSLTIDAAIEVMDMYHPTILFVNLKGVDEFGHSPSWTHYTGAIKLADRAVERLWNEINNDEQYRNNTTFIVTTDHGRHDIETPYKSLHRAFMGHSGICHGCQHVMFLIIGPDTPMNQEITRMVYQIDIAPTIGQLHGFSTPFARGQVLWEAVNGYSKQQRRLIMKEPVTDVDDDWVVMTWSDNHSGNDEIYYSASNDYGQSFRDTVQLSNSGVAAIQPSVTIDGDKVHAVWLDFKTNKWELLYKRSTNSGDEWEDEVTLFSSVVEVWDEEVRRETMAVWLWDPSILFEQDEGMITFTQQQDSIAVLRSSDGGVSWDTLTIDNYTLFPANANSCLLSPYDASVWCDQNQGQNYNYWEIYFKRPGYDKKILSTTSSYSIQPSISSDGVNDIGVTWADNDNFNFQIIFRESLDRGESWSDKVVVSNSMEGAWQPDLAWDPLTGKIHLVWTDYRDGHGELYYSLYDHGIWSIEQRLTNTLDGSVNLPQIAIDANGNTIVAWEVITMDTTYIMVGDPIP
jgi:hypothetical protein